MRDRSVGILYVLGDYHRPFLRPLSRPGAAYGGEKRTSHLVFLSAVHCSGGQQIENITYGHSILCGWASRIGREGGREGGKWEEGGWALRTLF